MGLRRGKQRLGLVVFSYAVAGCSSGEPGGEDGGLSGTSVGSTGGHVPECDGALPAGFDLDLSVDLNDVDLDPEQAADVDLRCEFYSAAVLGFTSNVEYYFSDCEDARGAPMGTMSVLARTLYVVEGGWYHLTYRADGGPGGPRWLRVATLDGELRGWISIAPTLLPGSWDESQIAPVRINPRDVGCPALYDATPCGRGTPMAVEFEVDDQRFLVDEGGVQWLTWMRNDTPWLANFFVGGARVYDFSDLCAPPWPAWYEVSIGLGPERR
jgi:hypothetical protein